MDDTVIPGVLYEYKGYKGPIEYSDKDKCFHGKILDIGDLVSYEDDTIKGLYSAFTEAVDDYIETKEHLSK